MSQTRRLPAYGPITPKQQARMDVGEAAVQAKRKASGFRYLLDRDDAGAARADGTATNCARCAHIGDFNAEHQVGWCVERRRRVGTWKPVQCQLFQAAT